MILVSAIIVFFGFSILSFFSFRLGSCKFKKNVVFSPCRQLIGQGAVVFKFSGTELKQKKLQPLKPKQSIIAET